MEYINNIANGFFELLIGPLSAIKPLWSLIIFSLPAGILLVLIFRLTSDQSKIRAVKESIKAHMLEIRLFKDDPRIMLSALGKIMFFNLRYMRYAVKPMLFMIIPVALMIVQLDMWYGYMPLKPGESSVVTIKLSDRSGSVLDSVRLENSGAIEVETPPMRVPAAGEVNWRIRAVSPGSHSINFIVNGSAVTKSVVVSDRLSRVTKNRVKNGLWDSMLNPGESLLPSDSVVEKVTVYYPQRMLRIGDRSIHWIILFLAATILAGFAFKGVLGVEI